MVNLQEAIKKCEEITGIKCDIPVKINNRMTRALGWTSFFGDGINKPIHDIKIELSGKLMKYGKDKDIVETLRHEYAHYCTVVVKGDHNHNDKQFKNYCKMLNTSYEPSAEVNLPFKYNTVCSCCGKVIGRYNRSNNIIKRNGKGYRSSCCHANIKVIQNY